MSPKAIYLMCFPMLLKVGMNMFIAVIMLLFDNMFH